MKLVCRSVRETERVPAAGTPGGRALHGKRKEIGAAVCPYTLEPSSRCRSRQAVPRHRCSFTLEPCGN